MRRVLSGLKMRGDEPETTSSSAVWFWKAPANRAVIQKLEQNANFLRNAVAVSESIVSCAFGISIFGNQIGFTVRARVHKVLRSKQSRARDSTMTGAYDRSESSFWTA